MKIILNFFFFKTLEPFLEAIPQVHLLIVIKLGDFIENNEIVEVWNLQTTITFCLSVLTAALGITKFLKVGPCRLLPYDKINLGFFLLTLNIACCLIWKGIFLGFVLTRTDVMSDTYSVMLWISVSILPQMTLVSYLLSHINYLVGRLKKNCTLYYIFQEFITLWTSRGFKETITVIWQFPAIILTPAFSFWVIGPIGKLKCIPKRSYTVETSTERETCWGKSKKIGISYLHTWINIGLTLSGEFWLVYLWHSGSSEDIIYYFFGDPSMFLLGICLASLCLIQMLDRCKRMSKINCPIMTKFVPNVTNRTLLNFDNPSEIIHLYG